MSNGSNGSNLIQMLPPGGLAGRVMAIESKSCAHRILLCAALSDRACSVLCTVRSKDILATVNCLRALGAQIVEGEGGAFDVVPLHFTGLRDRPLLDCGESGSTLRFLLPVVCALGAKARMLMHGRLPERPLSPLYEVLRAHGAQLGPQGSNPLSVAGPLKGHHFTIDASVSSQFVSGLLFALPLLGGGSVTLTGRVESAGYLALTTEAMRLASVDVVQEGATYHVDGSYRLPIMHRVEGDWSNAAFWLSAGALGHWPVTVTYLNLQSSQGDRAILDLLARFGAQVTLDREAATVGPGPLHGIDIDAAQIPDLVPVLAVVASVAAGETHIYNAGRLRIKESDRLQTTAAMLTALGGQVQELPDGLVIRGVPRLTGGEVDACNDHRIAMAAAVAACATTEPVVVRGAEAVEKSYPDFWFDWGILHEKALNRDHRLEFGSETPES